MAGLRMYHPTLGDVRAYWLAAVCCMGGFLFGYDSGVVGGVLTFPSYEKDFRYTKPQSVRVSSLAVGLQQAGAFVACFAIWPITHKFGRRQSLMMCSLIFCIGVILETVDTHAISAFYVGRVVAGIGLGASSVVVPIYISEMAPKEIRGRVGSCYQLNYTFGVLISYWVDYGVQKMAPSPRQWQIPIGLQLVPAGLLGLGMLTLKESVRWLVLKGEHDRAWESLCWIRGDSGDTTRAELSEIQWGLEEEARARAGFRPKELLERANVHRLALAIGIFLAQQSTGSTALAVFGPQFFALLVGMGPNNLLLTGIFGAIKVVACLTFVIFVSERVGRRGVLMGGSAFMSACMIATAAVDKDKPPPGGGVVTSAGIATIALIYLNIIAYNFSWGPLPWPYVSEIFPSRTREIGVGVGVSSQWLFNFVYTITTPYMIANMGWGTFLMYGLFDAVICLFCYLFVEETNGRSLEEIGTLFQPSDESKLVDPSGEAQNQSIEVGKRD